MCSHVFIVSNLLIVGAIYTAIRMNLYKNIDTSTENYNTN